MIIRSNTCTCTYVYNTCNINTLIYMTLSSLNTLNSPSNISHSAAVGQGQGPGAKGSHPGKYGGRGKGAEKAKKVKVPVN
jgi:hypothetical protein